MQYTQTINGEALLIRLLRKQEEMEAKLDARLGRIEASLADLHQASQKRLRPRRRRDEPGARLTDSEREALNSLLPAISEARGDIAFSVAELVAESAGALQAALPHLEGMSNKAVGKLFSRAKDAQLGDFSIHACDVADKGVVVWQVRCCPQSKETNFKAANHFGT